MNWVQEEIRLVSVQPSGWERMSGWATAHARCWVLRDRAGCSFGGGWISTLLDPFFTPGCVGEGYRPYFENYTVDASILDSGSLCGLFGSTRFARSSLRVVFLQIIGSATFRVVVS